MRGARWGCRSGGAVASSDTPDPRIGLGRRCPPLVDRMIELATTYGRYGYRRITGLLRGEGWPPFLWQVSSPQLKDCAPVSMQTSAEDDPGVVEGRW